VDRANMAASRSFFRKVVKQPFARWHRAGQLFTRGAL
jgi:hypothetical protein